MTNLETHLHSFAFAFNCLCESRSFKIWKKQPLEEFNKKCAFKNFEKLTGEHLRGSLFFNNVAGLRPAKIKTPAQVFSCQFYEIFENIIFT